MDEKTNLCLCGLLKQLIFLPPMPFEFEFQAGPLGIQIGHDCNIEEIDDGEQASKCPDMKVNDVVTHVNGIIVPDPKKIDQLRELIVSAGRPMTLTFESGGYNPANNGGDVKSLVEQVSLARREMKALRASLDASESAGSADATIQQLQKLLAEKEKSVKQLEQRLDAMGYARETETDAKSAELDEEDLGPNTLKVDVSGMPDDDELDASINKGKKKKKKKKKKRAKTSFRRFTTIIGRAFTAKKNDGEESSTKEDDSKTEEKNETSAAGAEGKKDNTKKLNQEEKELADKERGKKEKVLLQKKRDLQFELMNSIDGEEKNTLTSMMNDIDQRLNSLAAAHGQQTIVSNIDTGGTAEGEEEEGTMVSGTNVMQRGPLDPSSSMKWDKEQETLSTILETSERSENNNSPSINPTIAANRRPLNERTFGDISKTVFDPIDYRALEDDVYELYEQQFLITGRQTSLSIVSTDNEREKDQEAIRSIIKYYGKPLLVLFRAYANSSGQNRVGNNASFDTHSKMSKQINIASFMMMCTDFGLGTQRKDSNMNGRAGGGWSEPTIIDWIAMSNERLSTAAGLTTNQLERDELGNALPPSVDPPVLSTRGYLPVTKAEIKKIFQKVSGGKNQFKYVRKVGFLWVLQEIIKLAWPRLHADQINFEREMHSITALTAFRRVATKYVCGEYEKKFQPQFRILKADGSIAYQLWSNRQQRAFAEDEFGSTYKILGVVVANWTPLTAEEDQDGGMYDFGDGYEPLALQKGMVMQICEGMYNDSDYDNPDGEQSVDAMNQLKSNTENTLGEFPEDAYFSPLRRTMDPVTGTVSTGNEKENVDVEGVPVFYGKETTAGGTTGIFPSNCIRLIRVDYTFRNNEVDKTQATVRIQSLGRGYVFRILRARSWDACATIQKYVRGVLQRLWWARAIQVRTSRAEYNVATLLDAVSTEDRVSCLLHRMGLESFSSAVTTTATKSERGFLFAQGNATLPSSSKSHRTTVSIPKWMKDKTSVVGSRNQQPATLPRRQVSDARYQKKLDDHNVLNLRSYQEPRPNDQGMLKEVIEEFQDGLHMLYHSYSSQTGLVRSVHDKRIDGTFEAVDKNKRTMAFGEFGRICADFKLYSPVYYRDAKMASTQRSLETVYKIINIGQKGEREEAMEEMILRFSEDGALPVDRKLLKPLFNIESLRSANGLNASVPRLHSHLDLGYALADLAMAAAGNMNIPGGIHAKRDIVMGYNVGGGKNVDQDWMGGEKDDGGGVIGHFGDGIGLNAGRQAESQPPPPPQMGKEEEEADPMEIKIRVLFALLEDGNGQVQLVSICEALADADDTNELLMGNKSWKFPNFEGKDEEALLSSYMHIEECLDQFRVPGATADTSTSTAATTDENTPASKNKLCQHRPGYEGSKAEICKALFLRMRLDDVAVLDKVLSGYGRGMTFFTGRVGTDVKYSHTDLTTLSSGARHPIQQLRAAMHTIIQRGAKVHSLLQSYDKHAYGAVSGVLRITTMYDAITLMIERNLLKKKQWKKDIVPFLLKKFGTEEQEASVHKMYPTEEGVEYGRFVEWCSLPLPDYHNNPSIDVPIISKKSRGAPLLGTDRPDYYASRAENIATRASTGDSWVPKTREKEAPNRAANEKQEMETIKKQKRIKERQKRRNKRRHERKVHNQKSTGYAEQPIPYDDYEDSEDEEFFDDIEGDFSVEDAMYFRGLSLSNGVGNDEQRNKEQAKINRELKKQKRLKKQQLSPQEAEKKRIQDAKNLVLQGGPAHHPDKTTTMDDRPSSQGFMFIPPAVAKEADSMQQQQKGGVLGDSLKDMTSSFSDDVDAVAAPSNKDVWTWDDEEDGGGDAFFGTGEKRREEEEFFLTGPQPLQQQPQPPKTLPPAGMIPSPMQKRINPRYSNNNY